MSLVISKFGGTSVKNFKSMQNCVKLVTCNQACKVVVTSAPSGITNYLVALGNGGLTHKQRIDIFQQIEQQLLDILIMLVDTNGLIRDRLSIMLNDMRELACDSELNTSPEKQDWLLSYGERFASLLLTQCFIEKGINAVEFDIREILLTDDNHGSATPNTAALGLLAKDLLKPKLENKLVITQGFLGKTESGKTTTLGRGGSDYTAALLSEALDAEKCEIWTDVAGVYSTDPRIVSEAFPLPELSYDEAAEMANFGAKVLHPATLAPTLRAGIPVFVGSTKEPEKGGTTIVQDCEQEPHYRAITRRREQKLVTLQTPKLLRTNQFIGKVFSVLDRFGLSVDLITTSETSISLTLNASDQTNLASASKGALSELSQICDVEITSGLDLITIVGNKLHQNNGVTSKIFALLEDVSLRMISYGANPHNISFLLDASDSESTIKKLHSGLF